MFIRLRHHVNPQRGDTIIEVLIAIAIVSLILTTAYAITIKNTQSLQSNQERVQAQHLVEAQIESLKAANALTTSGDCFNSAGAESSGAACSVSAAGSGATYLLKVVNNSGIYTVSAIWTSLGGSGTNDSNVTMYYRL